MNIISGIMRKQSKREYLSLNLVHYSNRNRTGKSAIIGSAYINQATLTTLPTHDFSLRMTSKHAADKDAKGIAVLTPGLPSSFRK